MEEYKNPNSDNSFNNLDEKDIKFVASIGYFHNYLKEIEGQIRDVAACCDIYYRVESTLEQPSEEDFHRRLVIVNAIHDKANAIFNNIVLAKSYLENTTVRENELKSNNNEEITEWPIM